MHKRKKQKHMKMTMIWNIKLDMKNKTERQIALHSLPTPNVFNFFPLRTKILKFCQPTNGTFDFAQTHESNTLAKSKEPFFTNAQ